MNSTLLPISNFVDPVMMEFSEKALEKLHRLFVAFRRIRPSWISFVDNFQDYLKKLEKLDPDYNFFSSFIEALTNEHNKKPWEHLYNYLERKGFSLDVLASMQFSYDEKAFTNRLSKNPFILQILLFFFYQPLFSINFFLNSATYLSEEESILMSDFQKLPADLKKRVVAYTHELAKAYHLETLNKSP